METETGVFVLEWKIENFSHWFAEVHGHCIKSPKFVYPCSYIELYPKGIGGQGEHLVLKFYTTIHSSSFSGEFSFHSSDGSLLCSKKQVHLKMNTGVLELLPGPTFEDVLSKIREDFITVKLRKKDSRYWEKRICTTINVLKISLTMNPGWIENMDSNEKDVCFIIFSPDSYLNRIKLSACSKNNTLHFMFNPPAGTENPFAVEISFSLTGSDDTVDSCVKTEHVFRDHSPWTFLYPLEKKELIGKGLSLLLCLKTRFLIQSPFYTNFDFSNVSIELNNTPCFSERAPPLDPVTSNKVTVLTKDSGNQTSLTSDMPANSVLVLSKELMCLYQDQDFSDFQLKCENVTFPVHRAILTARSPVFKTMLSTDMTEATSCCMDIVDLDPSTLSRFLTYLYTGEVEEELQCDVAIKLYYAADKYQVPSLKWDCSKFLCSNVSVSNVCDILSLADRHRDSKLTGVSLDFLLHNYNAVLKSKEWESFMRRESLLAVETLTLFATKDSVVKKLDPK